MVTVKGKRLRGARFSWAKADITDRNEFLREQGVCSTDVLARIHRENDPDGKKAIHRLRKTYF